MTSISRASIQINAYTNSGIVSHLRGQRDNLFIKVFDTLDVRLLTHSPDSGIYKRATKQR